MPGAAKLRTQVGIVGAGPAGLMLSHLLHLEGVDSIVVETRSRKHIEERLRAGVLEQGTVDLRNEAGVGERMRREGLLHRGIELRFNGRAADVRILACVIAAWYRSGATGLLADYSEICLRRVWRAQHFSWWMTCLLHRSESGDGFDYRRQLAELEHLTTSRAAATSSAENYTGMPFPLPGEQL